MAGVTYDFYPETCLIYSRAPVVTDKRRAADSKSQPVQSRCLIEPLDKEQSATVMGLPSSHLQVLIYLPGGTKVAVGDKIKATSGQFNGVTFSVRTVEPFSLYIPHVEVGAEQEPF